MAGSHVMHYLLHTFHHDMSCGWWILHGTITIGRLANKVTQIVNEDVVLLSVTWHLMVRKSHA